LASNMLFALALPTLFAAASAAPSACVTGAGGFVSTEIVYQLLELGWEVHGTVRSLEKKEKYAFLEDIAEKFADKGGKLVMHEADLSVAGSFESCILGRDYVFHPATLFSAGEGDPYDYYTAAVAGSKNVLESVVKARDDGKPVKKVIATMSIFSITNLCNHGVITCPKTQQPKNGEYFNEDDWSHTLVPDGGYAYTKAPFEAYGRSKVDQDKFTREFCIINKLSCATVHPGLIIGPPRGTRVSGVSLESMLGMAAGGFWANFAPVGDNRDVALAHIKAALAPQAEGRYIVVNFQQISNKALTECLEKRFPGIKLAENDGSDEVPPLKISSKLTEELIGQPLFSPCQTWGDALAGFYDAGLAKNPGLHSEESKEL